MFKLFRFLESLEKINKKVGLRFGVKLLRKKKLYFLANFALLSGFFGISATIRIAICQEMLGLPYAGFF